MGRPLPLPLPLPLPAIWMHSRTRRLRGRCREGLHVYVGWRMRSKSYTARSPNPIIQT